MTLPLDFAPSCQVGVPGVLLNQRQGWYLIAANARVEAGPFATEADALAGAAWLDAGGWGVNPYPWEPVFSRKGMTIGSRLKGGLEAIRQPSPAQLEAARLEAEREERERRLAAAQREQERENARAREARYRERNRERLATAARERYRAQAASRRVPPEAVRTG